MKKGLKFLLLGLLALPVGVKADMGMPQPYLIDSVCVNTDGCKLYEYNVADKGVVEKETVKYGTKGTAIFSAYFDDIEYVNLNINNSAQYYGLKKDFKSTKDKVEPTDTEVTHIKNKSTAIVTNKDGVSLYSGPNAAFDTITKIPYGTKLEYEYGFDGKDGWGLIYLYTSYDGKDGWVYVGEEDTLLVKEVAEPIKGRTHKEVTYEGVTIPANTELEVKYAHYASKTTYYVKYEGKDVLFDSYYLAVENGKKFTLKQDIELKKNLTDEAPNKKIVKGSKVTVNNYTGTFVSAGSSESDEVILFINNIGWYKFDYKYDDNNNIFEEDLEFYIETKFRDTVQTEIIEPEKKEEPTKKKDDSGDFNPISLVILLFGVAVLMGGVSIVLIKSLKKKKDQEDNTTNNV